MRTNYHLDRICPICTKLFIPAPEHAYRKNIKIKKCTKMVYFCSWGCFRAYEKGAKLNDCRKRSKS